MTTLTILGAGNMARGIATRAIAGGRDVQIMARNAGKASDLAGELDAGGASLTAGGFGDAIAGDIVVLAVPYAAAVPLVRECGQALVGKIIVDITNPVDFTTFEPVTPPGISAAEEIAGNAPDGAPVVKAFNTTFAGSLVAGQVDGRPLDVFIASDDEAARAEVAAVVASAGLRPLDAGRLSRARQLEAVGLLHMALQFSLGTNFGTAVKILP
jgi:8-hydroxy-5-deazaflavin:NADPH oxidoreductase